jgi:Ca-activated chloride channel homolog
MKRRTIRLFVLIVPALLLPSSPGVHAQTVSPASSISNRPLASHIVVPQARAFALDHQQTAEITEITAAVSIIEQVATTTMDIRLRNPAGRRLEAELLVPVPDDAVIRGFTFQGSAAEPTAQVLPKGEARAIYDQIVAKTRDPALLEFAGYNLVRSSIFPIEANGTQTVRLIYETLLAADGDRIDYVLPRSESLQYTVPWKVTARIRAKRPISTLYSPSHRLRTTRTSAGDVTTSITPDAERDPGAFRLSYLLESNGVTASLLAYPDPKVGGGYFLMLAGLATKPPASGETAPIKREVTLVLDHSGSMSGHKIKQVREAARQILAGLQPGESFNLLVYNDTVDRFRTEPTVKTDATVEAAFKFLDSLLAQGGTNIHDALLEALRTKPVDGALPIVLFLTDGLPTVDQTSEVAIRNVAAKSNPHQRRIFTFGVGVDVNAPLLESIATDTRAATTFVLPNEDVEAKVGQVFSRLSAPILADITMEIPANDNRPRAVDLSPSRIPDLFQGDQFVLLGKYQGDAPLSFEIKGNYLGRQRTFRFTFALDGATTKNAFVPRLWASRKIATLVDAIRALGADGGPAAGPGTLAGGGRTPPVDPRIKELTDEIVRLSTEFGILTEYTAFLAREGTNLEQRESLLAEAGGNLQVRAMKTRSGAGGVNQSLNSVKMGKQSQLNMSNSYIDQNMNRVQITNVQQVSDRAFYNRKGRWVDSRIVSEESRIQPKRTVEFGSTEFGDLAQRLAREGRQGSMALGGDVLMMVDDEPVLIKGPAR